MSRTSDMMSKDTGAISCASLLEEKHLISILLYLKREGLTRKIDLYNNVSFNPRMPEKIDRLESAGLLEQKTDGYSRSTLLELTEKGRKIAQMLEDIDRSLKARRPPAAGENILSNPLTLTWPWLRRWSS